MEESLTHSHGSAVMHDAGETERLRNHVFNLKLRVYYLEEQLAQVRASEHDGGAASRLSKENVNLKVGLDEKSRELEERNILLRRARSAIENLQNELELKDADLQEAMAAPQREAARLTAERDAAAETVKRWKATAEEANAMHRDLQEKLSAAEETAARVPSLQVELEYAQARVEELKALTTEKDNEIGRLNRVEEQRRLLEEDLHTAKSTLTRTQQDLAAAEVKLSESASHRSMSESEHRSLVASLRQEIESQQQQREEAEEELRVKAQLLEEADKAIKELEDRADGQSDTIASLTNSLRRAEARVREMENEHSRFAESATSFKDEAQSRLEVSRHRERELGEEVVKMQAKARYMEETIKELRSREHEYKQELREKETVVTELRSELNRTVENTRDLSREIVSVQRQRDSAIAEAQATARADINSSIAEVKAEAVELHNTMQQQRERYQEQRQRLLEQVRHWYAHVKTVLVDFLRPPAWPQDAWANVSDANGSANASGERPPPWQRRNSDVSDSGRRGSLVRMGKSLGRDSVELTVEEKPGQHNHDGHHDGDHDEDEEEWRPEPEVVRLLERLPRVKVWFEETAHQCLKSAMTKYDSAVAQVQRIQVRLERTEAHIGPASAAAKAFAAAKQRDSENNQLLKEYQRVSSRAERLEVELKQLTKSLEHSENEHRRYLDSEEETQLLTKELDGKRQLIEQLQGELAAAEKQKADLQKSQRNLKKQVKERDEQIHVYMSRLERHLSSLGSTVPSPLAKSRSRTHSTEWQARVVLDEAAKHLDRAKGLQRDTAVLVQRAEDLLRVDPSQAASRVRDLFEANAAIARGIDILAARLTASFSSFPDIVRAVQGAAPGLGSSLVSPSPPPMPAYLTRGSERSPWEGSPSYRSQQYAMPSRSQEWADRDRDHDDGYGSRSRSASRERRAAPTLHAAAATAAQPQGKATRLTSSRSDSAVGMFRRSSAASGESLTRSRLKEVHTDMVDRLSNIGVALQDTATRLSSLQ